MISNTQIISKRPSVISVEVMDLDESISSTQYTPFILEKILKLKEFNCQPFKNFIQKIRIGNTGIISYNYSQVGVPYLKTKNILPPFIDVNDVTFITPEAHKRLSRSKIFLGDLLINKSGQVGASAIQNKYDECNGVSDLIIITQKGNIDPAYQVLFLNSTFGHAQFIQKCGGAIFNHISVYDIPDILIPVPSPEIQKYIGDKVRKAEKLRIEATMLHNSANQIFKDALPYNDLLEIVNSQSKFGIINSDQLNVNRLDAQYNQKKHYQFAEYCNDNKLEILPLKVFLSEELKSGSTPSNINYSEKGIPFLKANNLINYSINNEIVYVDESYDRELGRGIVNSGDILLSIAGTIGVASIIPEKLAKCYINQALIRIRAKGINKYYLTYALNSVFSMFSSLRNANGAVQLNLNKQEVENILIFRIGEDRESEIAQRISEYLNALMLSNDLLMSAIRDIEDLVEGNFEMAKECKTLNEQ